MSTTEDRLKESTIILQNCRDYFFNHDERELAELLSRVISDNITTLLPEFKGTMQ